MEFAQLMYMHEILPLFCILVFNEQKALVYLILKG